LLVFLLLSPLIEEVLKNLVNKRERAKYSSWKVMALCEAKAGPTSGIYFYNAVSLFTSKIYQK
jgi:hypothetical protein